AYQTQKGQSLSVTLSRYKEDFDPIFLTMVRVGEGSGTLDKSLDYLATQLSTSYELSQKIKGSLMYPAVIVVAMIGNGLLMAIFVLPRISSVFLKLDLPLPVYTQFILVLGNFFGNNSILVLVFTFVMLAGAVAFIRFERTRSILIRLITRVPVVKRLIIHIDIARYARTLATLLKNGVPIIESLDVSADSISHPGTREIAKTFGEKVSKGRSLSDVVMEGKKYFPSIAVQSIKAGEKSGKLDEVLNEMADFYEKEVDFSLKRMTSLIEPVMMLIIGVVVGVMVLMMISPIYSIIGGLQTTIQR
ncbi:MAG: Type IV pilin, partial [Candidatus Woesebacteria bacterium GW2011_GWC1_42_9]